jgi:cell division septation protein DedD
VRAWRLGLLGLVVLVAAVVVAAVVLLSGSGTHRQAASPARPASPTAVWTIAPSTVSVAVLNGTPTPGLANGVALRLRHDGYAKGPVTDAADQTRTVTTVAYMQGHRPAALSVARALGLKPASVEPVDSGTRAVACGGATACTVTVVVTVGSHYPSR